MADPTGLLTVSSTQTFTTSMPNNYAMSVSCPPVVQPNVSFACSFTTAGSAGNVTFSYFDVKVPATALQTTPIATMREFFYFDNEVNGSMGFLIFGKILTALLKRKQKISSM